jgi:uncharacterized protein involved in outer membrane biogenesis
MSKAKKIALVVLIFLVVIVAGLAIVVPLLVDVDRYRPQVAAQIQRETGKPVAISRLTLTILPRVAIRVDDFSLGNPAGFPTGDFVKAKKIYAVVSASALLHHQVEILSLEFDGLALNMWEDTHGRWNFENPPRTATAPASPSANGGASFTLGVISRLRVARGQFTAASLLASGAPGPSLVEIHGAAIDLHDVNLNAMTATASLRAPASAPNGLAILKGWFNTRVYAADTNGPAAAEGTMKADALLFGPINVTKLKSRIRLYPKQVYFDDLDLNCYSGSAAGKLTLNFGGANLAYALDAKVKDVKIAEFLDWFPQTKGLMTGTLEGAATMNGRVLKSADPLEGVTGVGTGTIRDGKMPSLQITGNLRSLARIAGVGPADGDPSSFSSLSADFRIADDKLSSSKIVLDGNGVDVNGSGSLTMAGEGSLDYAGEASVAASGSNPLTAVLGGLAGATFADGKMTFPFTLGGTFARPKFSLKGGAAGHESTSSANSEHEAKLVRGLSGLFKRRKQQ